MKNLQKGFIGLPVLIAIILGIVVLGGGAYFVVRQNATPQTPLKQDQANTTKDTQTSANGQGGNQINIPSSGTTPDNKTLTLYKSESCGFEVSFPSQFVNWDQPANKNPKECPNPIPSYDPYKEYLQINSLRLKSETNCNISQSGESQAGCNYFSIEVTNSQITGPKVENISVDGIPAEKLTMIDAVPGGGVGQILIQFKKNKLWYRYTHTFSPSDAKEAEKLSDSIISTFKFTK